MSRAALLVALLALLARAPLAQAGDTPAETIAGHPYAPLATRAETEARMLELLSPVRVAWGDWHVVSPFPYAGHDEDDLATPYGPEAHMERFAAGGPGPDLDATYEGKNGTPATWRRLGDISGRALDLHSFEAPELSDGVSCYLHAALRTDVARRVEVDCGSDDGMRLWLNGRLLVDHDVPRGLDPLAEHVVLDLEPGLNHLLVKVADGVGGWQFQIEYRERLDPRVDAHLQYLLDRDFPPSAERDHWRVLTVPVPSDVVLEVGGLDFFSDGAPAVCTRRGDVWRVADAYAEPPLDARYERFASGLHEPLGLAVRREDGRDVVYCVQRPELTRLVDEDGDGRADLYECFSDGWGVSGNYHEFAFGPKFDREGNAWVTLNVGFCGSLGKSVARWRGWALKITPEGAVIPVASGLRSPNGIAESADGAMFYVDNQGDWVATNRMTQLEPGSYHGHPASLRWDDEHDPAEPPSRQPATVWFPYRKMGQSAADIALDDTGGAFGPFDGQLFVGDQTAASVMRVFLEEVEGHWQGACFPFLEGLQCGVNRVAFAPDGSMFVGQTDRGWGSVGGKPYGLQRVVYTGVTPFEILAVRAEDDGFELELTADADVETALDPTSYRASSWTYEYHAAYGAPEDDVRELEVEQVLEVGPRRLHLVVSPLRAGYLHELAAPGLRAADGRALLHDTAWYTLERVPGRLVVDDADEDLPRVLFLTHSAGFRHEVVERPAPDVLSHAEVRLMEAARGRLRLRATQDCGELTARNLQRYDAVLFFTTGELPVPEAELDAFVDWVAEGGAFAGVHSAADTLYEYPAYGEMLGGVFDGHPWHQEVGVEVERFGHPANSHLVGDFRIEDEIYQFRDWRRFPQRVLLELDTDTVDVEKGARADGDYALSWARDFGRGRVFYTALGHEPDVWADPRFLDHLLGGIEWAVRGPDQPGPAPPEAFVLFDGSSVIPWKHRGGGTGRWRLVAPDAMEVVAGTGDLVSRVEHGDALVHVEFRVPEMPEAEGQARGNSGVYVHGRYEVQVLDSFGLEPGMGDCGSIYGVKVVDHDACRVPGRWQSYDIEFTAPRFGAAGAKVANARMTVWHNGRLVHDDVELPGPTAGGLGGEVGLGPLLLQDHGDPVQYRNVWILPRE